VRDGLPSPSPTMCYCTHRFLVLKNCVPIPADVQDLKIGLPVLQYLRRTCSVTAKHLAEDGRPAQTRLRNGRSLHKTATLTVHQSHQAPLSLHKAINKQKRRHFSDRNEHGKIRYVNIATACFSFAHGISE
jgi:hypothetical protein